MRRLLLVLAVSLGLSGCLGLGGGLVPVTPETPRESLVTAEAAYEFALLEVKSLIKTGIIVPGSDQAWKVKLIIIETRNALDAWQLSPDSPKVADAAGAALRILQAEVARMTATQGADRNGWIGVEGDVA